MALGIVKVRKSPRFPGGVLHRVYDLTFDAAYAAGGYAITPAQVGMSKAVDLIVGTAPGFTVQWISATGKLQIFDLATHAEAATNLAGLNGVIARVSVWGY